jgi:hypothetical protein
MEIRRKHFYVRVLCNENEICVTLFLSQMEVDKEENEMTMKKFTGGYFVCENIQYLSFKSEN